MAETDHRFLQIGDQIITDLRDLTRLNHAQRVLDVGCGYGRVAHALIRHGFPGSYLGFDPLRPQIDWCQANLPRHARSDFRFVHVDAANQRYNPSGRVPPEQAEFPIPADAVDLLIVSSPDRAVGRPG